jgi:hypothetical protein
VAALVSVVAIGRIHPGIRARQVIQQDIEAGVEQIGPAREQVTERRLLVGQQEIVTGAELVGLDESKSAPRRSTMALLANQYRLRPQADRLMFK